jgi:hypothetical protein
MLRSRSTGPTAVLHRAGGEDRQGQARHQERHDIIGRNLFPEDENAAGKQNARGSAQAEADQAAAGQIAAQAVKIAAGAVFGDEALGSRRNAERARHAEKADPGQT